MDADSNLEQDALAQAALPFIEDPLRTVATGGTVRIANGCHIEHGRVTSTALPGSRLAMFQLVEYRGPGASPRPGWAANPPGRASPRWARPA